MQVKFTFLTLLALVFATACNQPSGEAAATTDAQGAASASTGATAYVVDPATSVVNWEGTKPTGKHMGTIPVTSGQLSVEGNNITAGSFELNVAGLTVNDLQGEEKGKLEGHLKTGDFFEVEKFPTASFVITGVTPAAEGSGFTHNISGDLTMKGQTQNITVPANVVLADGKLTATTQAFTIDRTKWGVTYASTMLKTAADKLINDQVGITISLSAAKQ
jgi:polyisoprenoid-binding protein YceI